MSKSRKHKFSFTPILGGWPKRKKAAPKKPKKPESDLPPSTRLVVPA